MTMIEIEITGGLYDGAMAHVVLDENGQPPELYTTDRIGDIDLSADPYSGPIAPTITSFFELRNAGTEDAPNWVYQFMGESSDTLAPNETFRDLGDFGDGESRAA